MVSIYSVVSNTSHIIMISRFAVILAQYSLVSRFLVGFLLHTICTLTDLSLFSVSKIKYIWLSFFLSGGVIYFTGIGAK